MLVEFEVVSHHHVEHTEVSGVDNHCAPPAVDFDDVNGFVQG